jgi:hypothetical protein
MTSLARTLSKHGQCSEAELLIRVVLKTQERVLDAKHLDTLQSMDIPAGAFVRQGRAAEAEVLLHQALGIKERMLGPEHDKTLKTMQRLTVVLETQDSATKAVVGAEPSST